MLPLCWFIVWLMAVPAAAFGEANSIFDDGHFSSGRGALVQVPASAPEITTASGAPSLFIGRAGSSFFRPYPVRIAADTGRVQFSMGGSTVDRIRHLIAVAEAGPAGYDAVQHGAKVRPPRRPTAMTVAEIYAWIDATPGQPHAIGRYQFIPATLRRLVTKTGVHPGEVFGARVQDKLADALLAEAGLNAVHRGEISRHQFMRNLAKIWAGLPLQNGQSYYHGYAGNKATMSWAQFDAEMARIFPG